MENKDRDIHFAEKIGGLTSAVQSLDKTITAFTETHSQEHAAMWKKMDRTEEMVKKNTDHISKFRGGLGVIVSVITLMSSFLGYLFAKFFKIL